MDITSDDNRSIHLLSLILLACVAFAIRFKGVWFGYPLPLHPDEPLLVETALRMLRTGDLNPHFFNYPTLIIYIQAVLFRIMEFFAALFTDKPASQLPEIWYYIVGRTFNVVMSTVAIIVVYLIGKRLFSSLAGLFAAFFLTFSFLHITNSYFVTVDSSVATWVSLATLAAAYIYTKGKKTKYYLLGGIFVGLAVSSKYTAFVSVAPLLVAHFSHGRKIKDMFDKDLVVCLLAVPIVFLFTTPYAILDFDSFLNALLYESRHYSSGHPGAESETGSSYYLYGRYLVTVGNGAIPLIFSGIGLAWLLRDAPWKAAIVVATPVLLYMLVGRYKVFFPRNIVAVLPFLSILGGAFVFLAYKELQERLHFISKPGRTAAINLAFALVISGAVWPQAISALHHIETINLPDTRWISMQWIDGNLPGGSRIGREHYTPPVEKYSDKFYAFYLGYFATARNSKALTSLDYMIVSSYDYDRFLDQKDRYPAESQAYSEFFQENELVKEFIPDSESTGGPKISIYRMQR